MIFIIGGRGLVGSAFTRACDAAGRLYAVIDRANYKDHIGASCDLLVNANGNSRKPLAQRDPVADFEASVLSVRRSLVDFDYKRYILLSSCDVYPDCSSPTLTDEHRDLDNAQQSPYGFHKHLAEQCVRFAAGHAGKPWLIFRCGGFVGSGLKKNPIFDILNGGPLWLDPDSELQFLNTDDAARLMLALDSAKVANEVINLCGRGTVSLREVMQHAARIVPVNPGSTRHRYDVNITRLASLLQQIGLEVPETRTTVFQYVDTSR